MDTVVSLPLQDRSDLFRATADRMDLAPAIIEKDFWVCWTLRHLFQLPDAMDDLIFKGGTTLSKVYKVIQRFSEDVDISISRSRLGFVGDRDPGNAMLSNKRRQRTDL
jgi:predicted nucleotidyltransferase component of viral defense system